MRRSIPFLLSLTFLAACGSDEKTVGPRCNADELFDELNNVCVPRPGGNNQSDMGDTGTESDADDMGTDTGNNNPNNNPNNNMVDPCDKDNDGVKALSCGGQDCNDESRRMSPNIPESCDELDNDCDGVLNDGIDCSFYAHTSGELFRVDVFNRKLELASDSLPGLRDIDTHPNGILYGVNSDGVLRYDESRDEWDELGDFGIEVNAPNGLAIDSQGTVYVTAESDIFTVDLATGEATLLGDVGQGFIASGDCVVNKLDTLYMTSKDFEDGTPDELVLIDRATASGQSIGLITDNGQPIERVYALTAAFGDLYGLTATGELIKIDATDGSAEILHTFVDDENEIVRFAGAASTPDR